MQELRQLLGLLALLGLLGLLACRLFAQQKRPARVFMETQMKVRIAAFASDYGMNMFFDVPAASPNSDRMDFVGSPRLTEFVEVELPDLPKEVTVPAQLAALDAQIAELTDTFTGKVRQLQNQRAELLALTSDPS